MPTPMNSIAMIAAAINQCNTRCIGENFPVTTSVATVVLIVPPPLRCAC